MLAALPQLDVTRAAWELLVIDSGWTEPTPLLPLAHRNTTTLA